jgi:hypothetical protein
MLTCFILILTIKQSSLEFSRKYSGIECPSIEKIYGNDLVAFAGKEFLMNKRHVEK